MALIESITLRRPAAADARRMSLVQRLALWRSRRDLARLDARALEDIGITADAAEREARLGMWDAPENWLKRC